MLGTPAGMTLSPPARGLRPASHKRLGHWAKHQLDIGQYPDLRGPTF
jgi:hypothetical protein